MKQVCVNAATCSVTRSTTSGALLPTLTTAMPLARSISELPSTSTITPPPAAATYTGSTLPTPDATAAVRRSCSARDRGPGISVTSRRSWGRSGPPVAERSSSVVEPVVSVVMWRSRNGISDEDEWSPQYLPRRFRSRVGSGCLRRGHAARQHSGVEHGPAQGGHQLAEAGRVLEPERLPGRQRGSIGG